MQLYDTEILDEAMHAIKEELIKDLSESILFDNKSEIPIDNLTIN